MFKFFHLFRSSQHLHHSIILFLLLLLIIGPVSSQEVTPEPQPSPTALPTSTLPPPPTSTPIPTNTDLPPPTATSLPTNTETPTATSTSTSTNTETPTATNTPIATNTETSTSTLTSTPASTETPLTPSPTAETTLPPSATIPSTPTAELTPSPTPFVPSPTPLPGDALQSFQPDAFAFTSSLPIDPVTLDPQTDENDLIRELEDANPTTCTHHTVITLPPGKIYTLTATHNSFFDGTGLPVIRCEVTINGTQTQIIRDPNLDTATPPDYFRIFGVNATGILRLNGIEIRNGYATSTGGGGILNLFGGQVYLNNTVVENNVANQTGTPQTLGGGIYSYEGVLEITSSRILNNRNDSLVGDGGGIGVINAQTMILNSEIADNTTTRDGGGAAILFTGNASVNQTCIYDNDLTQLFANNALDAVSNWWDGVPSVNSSVDSDSAVLIRPTDCTDPDDWTYNIIIVSAGSSGFGQWSLAEEAAINSAVDQVGRALDVVSTKVSAPKTTFNRIFDAGAIQIFDGVLFVRGDTTTNLVDRGTTTNVPDVQVTFNYAGQNYTIIFYDINKGVCKSFQAQTYNAGSTYGVQTLPNAVVCNGELLNQGIGGNGEATEYTIGHELGHVFDYASGDMLTDAIDNSPTNTFSLGSCNSSDFSGGNYIVMGYLTASQPFLRGSRGWGSGPGFSTFQQSPEDTAFEAAADMFLNWVYRLNDPNGSSALVGVMTGPIGTPNPPQSGCVPIGSQNNPPSQPWMGFLNRNWNAQGAPYDWGLPGDVRHTYMIERMPAIFTQNNW